MVSIFECQLLGETHDMKPGKYRGTFEDLLTDLFLRLQEHEIHQLKFSLRSLDWAEVYCLNCRSVILGGSRELIEHIWLEFNIEALPQPGQSQ